MDKGYQHITLSSPHADSSQWTVRVLVSWICQLLLRQKAWSCLVVLMSIFKHGSKTLSLYPLRRSLLAWSGFIWCGRCFLKCSNPSGHPCAFPAIFQTGFFCYAITCIIRWCRWTSELIVPSLHWSFWSSRCWLSMKGYPWVSNGIVLIVLLLGYRVTDFCLRMASFMLIRQVLFSQSECLPDFLWDTHFVPGNPSLSFSVDI